MCINNAITQCISRFYTEVTDTFHCLHTHVLQSSCVAQVHSLAMRTINEMQSLLTLVTKIRFFTSREDLLATAVEGISDEGQRAIIQLVLNVIPSERRVSLIRLAFPFFDGTTDGLRRAAILVLLASLHERTRQSPGLVRLVQEAAPMVARFIHELVMNPQSVASSEQRAERLSRLLHYIQEIARDEEIATSFVATTLLQANNSYRLEIVRDELENYPENTLNTLCELFKDKVYTTLNIRYVNEVGVDVGGLGRQFINDLFSGILNHLQCKRHTDSGLYTPELVPQRLALADEEKKSYHGLGQVMMFCLNASLSYPIGILFDDSVFIAIKEFTNADLDRNFDELINDPLCLDKLFGIYQTVHASLPQSTLDYMKNQFAQDKQDFALTYLRPALACVFEIAKGMKSAPFSAKVRWQAVQEMPIDQLSKTLQGSLSRDNLLTKLRFDDAIPPEKQQWVKEWIQKATDEQIKQFLYTLTGTTAIGSEVIKIKDNSPTENAPLFFHTCFNLVDIPFAKIATDSEFNAVFEATLGGTKKFNRS